MGVPRADGERKGEEGKKSTHVLFRVYFHSFAKYKEERGEEGNYQ